MEVLEEAMNTIKDKGFINYYGMTNVALTLAVDRP